MAFPTGWLRRCKLHIPAAAVTADSTDYPWLFTWWNLHYEIFDADGLYHALEGGGDIRFTSDAAGTTRLSIEVVRFHIDNDPNNGKAEIWVKVPFISASTGADVYIWYGKSGETQPARDATYGSEDVWSSLYRAVYHFNEDPSTTDLNDSTSYELHAARGGGFASGDLVDGTYGKAVAPDGATGEGYTVADNANLEPVSVSLELVIQWPNQNVDYAKIAHKGYGPTSPYGSYCIQHEGTVGNGNTSLSVQFGRNDGTRKSTATGLSINTWYHVLGTIDSARFSTIYTEGASRDSDDHGSGTIQYDAYGLGLFRTGNDTIGGDWIGIIEELRIMSSARSANYAYASYYTQRQLSNSASYESPMTFTQYITPNGIGGAEAWGAPVITVAQITVHPNSITSGEAWGSPTLTPGNVNVAPNSIESSEAWGSPYILTGAIVVYPNGIPSSEVWGNPSLMYNVFVNPNSIPSGESWGSPSLSMQIRPRTIYSSEAWGQPIITIVPPQFIQPYSIMSGLIFGYPTIVPATAYILPNSILSGEAWGTPTLGKELRANSIPSSEAWGLPEIKPGVVHISANSIPSAEQWGNPTVSVGSIIISPAGIASSEVWGIPTIHPETAYVSPNSIESNEQWGSPSVIPGTAFVNPIGIVSEGAWGIPSISVGPISVQVNSILSSEQWGSPYVTVSGVQISPFSIVSGEAFGTPTIVVSSVNISPHSIDSGEQWGVPTVVSGGVVIAPTGIVSQESWGSVNISQQIRVDAIISEEGWGSPSISVGPVDIQPRSILTSEAWGSPIVRNVLIITLEGYGIQSSELWGLPFIVVVQKNEFQLLMETDLEEGFFNTTEFAETSLYIHKDGYQFPLVVIFDNESVEVDAATNTPVLSKDPVCQCQSSDFVREYKKGDLMVVRGVRYQVVSNEPDGTGVSIIQLHHERTV